MTTMPRRKRDFVILLSALVFLAPAARAVFALESKAQEQSQDRMRLILAHDNTSFPLTGNHKFVDCGGCHIRGVLGGTPETCEACHWDRRQDDPNRLQLGTQCADCHTTASWARILPGAWDHEERTGFALEGSHASLSCTDCHSTRSFGSTTAECVQCHQNDFRSARMPDHQAASFPTSCELCHLNQVRWEGASFDHGFFPLTGPHKAASCESCHSGGRFAGTATDCFSCHRADFASAQSPNHQQSGFATDCLQCHTENAPSWKGAKFDHDQVFPLRGTHQSVECAGCHRDGVFAGTSSNCYDCHRGDYERTTNPNHLQAGFPTDCASCHGISATSWGTASFDHASVFPLKGMHRAAQCSACHESGNFSATPSECVDCHRSEYQRTSQPNHLTAGFSTSCAGCHGDSATSWQGASFDHERVFPLRGRHRAAECTQCHANDRFAGTPSTCIACHQSDYQGTRNPNHASAGFGTDCATCHGEAASSWSGASFDHNRFFQLSGKHRAADCASCHVNGRFAGTPSNCIDCHRADYDRATAPNHRQAGFSTDCASCHGTQANSWTGATFNHNQFFPLQGAHRTLDCQACHARGYDLPRDCFGCHAPDYNAARNPDHVRSGFPTSCENCHLAGHTSWNQAVFQHDFPINSGPHAKFDCVECHQTSTRQFSCILCHEHEKNRMDDKHDEVGGYVYNSQACYGCHPNGRE